MAGGLGGIFWPVLPLTPASPLWRVLLGLALVMIGTAAGCCVLGLAGPDTARERVGRFRHRVLTEATAWERSLGWAVALATVAVAGFIPLPPGERHPSGPLAGLLAMGISTGAVVAWGRVLIRMLRSA